MKARALEMFDNPENIEAVLKYLTGLNTLNITVECNGV